MIETIESILIWACIPAYLILASWTFGYVCGKWSEESDGYHAPSYWYDEPSAWFAAGLWPIYILVSLFLKRISHLGESRALNNGKARRVRVELERKIRMAPGIQVDAKGKAQEPPFKDKEGKILAPGSRTDQINGWLPAVPVGDTYWGYSSVPSQDVEWWVNLPTYPKG